MSFLFCVLFGLATLTMKTSADDVGILQYALTLEHLENTFYEQGLQKFSCKDFDKAGFKGAHSEFQRISDHESTHVEFLTGALVAAGETPVPPCTYNFPYKNVQEFVGLARALERTGVSAYLGVLNQIKNPDYTTAAGTITTIEARHASYLNVLEHMSGFPQAFDTPVSQRSIVGIISTVITSCPYDLPVAPYGSLSISPASGRTGTTLTLTASNSLSGKYCTFLFGSDQLSSQVIISHGKSYCKIPKGVSGDAYVFITSNNKDAITLSTDSSITNGPTVFTVTN